MSDIKSTVQEVGNTVDEVKQSAREFDKNIGVLKEFNERFRALSDQVIGLQQEAVSQRTDTVPLPAGGLDAANADSDEQNWEEFRTIWKRNNQRLETVIKKKLTGAKQRKYDNYSRTDYPSIIDRLFEDGALTRTGRDKSIELHRMFMTYKTRRRPVTEEVVANVRVLDEQLNQVIDTEPKPPQDEKGTVERPSLATETESKQKSDLADASAGNTDGRPDGEKGT